MSGGARSSGRARIFLLSPASLSGARGRRVLRGRADVGQAPDQDRADVHGRGGPTLAEALARGGALPLADVYSAISSLYFRGKVAYARRFGRRPGGGPAAFSITSSRGLMDIDEPVTLEDLRRMAETRIDPTEPEYVEALRGTVQQLRLALASEADFVLLGSIATPKYLDPLVGVFGADLLFPLEFVGRGDMSRGGLMLRAVDAGRELEYVEARSARRRGPRPPRLEPRSRSGLPGSG